MISSYDVSDVALAVEKNGEEKDIYRSAKRLMRCQDDDIRVIAAQALLGNKCANSDDIRKWIKLDNSWEVRGWLYIAIASQGNRDTEKFLNELIDKTCKGMRETEWVFLNAAMAISTNSRVYLLEVMKSILSKDDDASNAASMLSRMLINEDALREMNFIDVLEENRTKERVHDSDPA